MKSMGVSYKTDGHGNAEFIKLSNDDVSTTIQYYSTHLQYHTTAYYNKIIVFCTNVLFNLCIMTIAIYLHCKYFFASFFGFPSHCSFIFSLLFLFQFSLG